MKYERMNIYEKSDRYGISYFIVLGVSSGISVIYLTDIKSVYDEIEGAHIKEGYVQFDRILFIPARKISTRGVKHIRKLSSREYSNIINTISSYMRGDIVYDNRKMVYADEVGHHTYTKDDSNDIETLDEQNKIEESNSVEEPTVESNTDESIDDQSEPEVESEVATEVDNSTSDCDTAKSQLDVVKDAGIPIDSNNSEKISETYYDLVNRSKNAITSKFTGNRRYGGNDKHNSEPSSRTMFSETETLEIAVSDITMVSLKYNVSSTTAKTMIDNAKRIVNLEDETKRIHTVKNTFSKLYDKGYSIEEVAKLNNVDISVARINYNRYSISRNALDATNIERNYYLMTNDYINHIKELVSADEMGFTEFSRRHKCTAGASKRILGNIKNTLCIEPLYAAGFGEKAFSPKLKDEIDIMRKASATDIDVAMVFVYDICNKLREPYVRTYEDHMSILVGTKNIPDDVPKELRNYFTTLIYNRFHRSLCSVNRILNKEQRHAIEIDKGVADVIMAFMMVNKRYKSIHYKYSKRILDKN